MQIPASSTAFVETLSFDDPTLANALFGPHNAHLNVIAERTGADLSTRGTTLAVTSDDPALRERILNLFTQFYGLLRSGHALQSSDLEQGLQLLENDPGSDLRRSFRDEAVLSLPKKTVTARNAAQRAYLETLRSNEMVFSVGPAGTGKTYLAVAMAVHMLNARRVRRIILTRPALLRSVRITSRPLPCSPLIASERHAAQKSWSPAARSGANSHSAGLPNGSSADRKSVV